MKLYKVALEYLYNYIEAEIEARNEKEAVKIFWLEVIDNEGKAFAERANTHGKITVDNAE